LSLLFALCQLVNDQAGHFVLITDQLDQLLPSIFHPLELGRDKIVLSCALGKSRQAPLRSLIFCIYLPQEPCYFALATHWSNLRKRSRGNDQLDEGVSFSSFLQCVPPVQEKAGMLK
jgi:hypothetical protein